jgi:trk system potassium uptake protein TrkA
MFNHNNKHKNTIYGVIGLGRFGSALAKKLSEKGEEVLVIDCIEAKVKDALNYTDNAFVIENLSKENLQNVGIKNCDTVIVCIGEKADVSILVVLTVINLGIKRVIAKATSFEQGCVLEKLGAEVVYPERDMAVRLANKLMSSTILEYISLSEDIDISEIRLTNKMHGVTIIESQIRLRYGLNAIALKRGTETKIEISPDQLLKEGDILVVVGRRMNISKFERYLTM